MVVVMLDRYVCARMLFTRVGKYFVPVACVPESGERPVSAHMMCTQPSPPPQACASPIQTTPCVCPATPA